jgi:hypothetical protein
MITTSHCEPLLFNNASLLEWDKKVDGEWDYSKNKQAILAKLDARIKEAGQYENIYTLAMRGLHDEGMRGNMVQAFQDVYGMRAQPFVLTEQMGNGLLSFLFLYFFYRLGSAVERSIGTLKFNLFYLVGVVMMDVFAMVFCPTENVIIGNYLIPPEAFTYFYGNMSYYLHLGIVLAFATMYPDSQFVLFFILPVKAWVIALLDLIMIAISVFNMCYPTFLFPHCLFPLIGLVNYFLFFGPDMGNLLPLSWRVKLQRRRSKKANSQSSGPRVVQFTPPQQRNAKPDYNHRCTVCGRTDVTNPELEFRYCSRCNGYHCYCQDHINNHTHI